MLQQQIINISVICLIIVLLFYIKNLSKKIDDIKHCNKFF